jgi:prepilin-type N-terminal cleavage/methylation domain-containing protein
MLGHSQCYKLPVVLRKALCKYYLIGKLRTVMAQQHSQKGDTIIEVMVALVVLGLVVVGAVTMMTRGMSMAQMAVEHSETRLEVNQQLELLRYLRSQYVADDTSVMGKLWKVGVVEGSNNSAFNYSNGCAATPSKLSTVFFLNQDPSNPSNVLLNRYNSTTQNIDFKADNSYATAGKGVWVEIRPSSSISPAYVDVIVRACWASIDGGVDQQTVTAERLYDPSH